MFDVTMKLKRYDYSMDSYVTMYDNLPYIRNYDYCNESHIGLISGNIMKFYAITPSEEIAAINNHDDDIEARLQAIAAQAATVPVSETDTDGAFAPPDGITSEQMEHLLSDQPEDTEEDMADGKSDVIDFSNINF